MSFKFALNVVKYEDTRNEIVNYLKENSEFSGQFDFTSSNMALIIDAMAYVTMLMSYQVSNTASNLFLDSTAIRKNALSIAKTMGYRPQRAIASRVTGTISYYDESVSVSGSTITIPATTQFVSNSGYTYINYDPIVLEYYDNHTLKANVSLYEGVVQNYTYLGNGNPFQIFIIPSKKIEESYFKLKVRKNTDVEGTLWDEVRDSFNLINLNSYFVEEDINTEGYVRVIFGDKYITNYPTNEEIVDVQYLETNAEVANNSIIINIVSDNVTSTLVSFDPKNFNISKLSSSYGGKPIETLEIIKERAAKKFATVGRAVTQNDYITLLAQNAYILKANAIGGDTLFPNNPDKLGNIYLSAVPIIQNMNTDFYNSNNIYLNIDQETEIVNLLDRYRIISTYLSFLKPTYISIDVTPYVEIKSNASGIEVENIKTNVYNALNAYSESLIEFSPIIRESKINGIMSEVSGIISSYFTSKYSFALTKNSFYYPNTDNNMIFLPIMFDGTHYLNFIRTNQEQAILLDISYPEVLAIEDRTIYGQIKTANNERYLYNEDIESNGSIDTCDLKIYGKNKFFDMYRFETDLLKNKIVEDSIKKFTFGTTLPTPITISSTVVSANNYQYDNYTIDISGTVIGTIKRTKNREYGYKGLISKESNITSTTNGDFYKASYNFPVSGSDKEFNSLLKDDVIIYNSALSGAKWIKATLLGDISAVDDIGLFGGYTKNVIYEIESGTVGDFDGYTPVVSGGESIIFNINSDSPYHWDKMNKIFAPNMAFDASIPIVEAVVDYEIKKIINLNLATTTFNGRTNSSINLVDDDLIYYDPINNKWERFGNTSASGAYSVTTIDSNPISGGSLEIFNYHPVSGLAIGTAYNVVGIGNFGTSSYRVNYQSLNEVAYDGDILLYIGDGKWNLWQESLPDIFNIDGNIPSALPIKLTYGDIFSISTSGNFILMIDTTYTTDDYIVYIGSNEWIKYSVMSTLNPSSHLNLPLKTNIGEMYRIVEDGNFNNSYTISPSGDVFIQGDYIIYNGTEFTKVNEYTFEYALIDNVYATGREYLNSLGFNSVFYYDYDYYTKYYNFNFYDIYHDVTIGLFRYNSIYSDSTNTLYDTSKMTFEKYIKGYYDYTNIALNVKLGDIFDDDTVNKIVFLPKNKTDVVGNLTTEEETNFETNFNSFIILNILPTQVQ